MSRRRPQAERVEVIAARADRRQALLLAPFALASIYLFAVALAGVLTP